MQTARGWNCRQPYDGTATLFSRLVSIESGRRINIHYSALRANQDHAARRPVLAPPLRKVISWA
jgi:hypothetical protein